MDENVNSASIHHGGNAHGMSIQGQDSTPSICDDKEIFIKKTFEVDPRKGCELLFKRYYQSMCSHAVRFVYSKEIAQDLVADIFSSIWEKQLYLNITISYRAYLFTAVRNRSLKYLTKEFGKIDNTIDLTDLLHESTLPTPQQIMQYNELYVKIEKTIQALAPQCQKVFLMNRFEGKKYQTISDELHVSLKTVEAHISKALTSLRKALRSELIIALFALFIPFA